MYWYWRNSVNVTVSALNLQTCPELTAAQGNSVVVDFPGPLEGEFRCTEAGRKQIDAPNSHFCRKLTFTSYRITDASVRA